MSSKSSVVAGPKQGTSVDDLLQETALGAFISRFKIPLIILMVALVAGVIGYGIYTSQTRERNLYNAAEIYAFEQKQVAELKAGTLSAAAFSEAFSSLAERLDAPAEMAALTLSSADLLAASGNPAEALQVLTHAQEMDSPYVQFFVGLREMALLEDQGQTEAAIKVGEGLLASQVKLLEEKIYLDLGRLYQKSGNTQMAIQSFEYLKDKVGQAEFKKLADIYLKELGAGASATK